MRRDAETQNSPPPSRGAGWCSTSACGAFERTRRARRHRDRHERCTRRVIVAAVATWSGKIRSNSMKTKFLVTIPEQCSYRSGNRVNTPRPRWNSATHRALDEQDHLEEVELAQHAGQIEVTLGAERDPEPERRPARTLRQASTSAGATAADRRPPRFVDTRILAGGQTTRILPRKHRNSVRQGSPTGVGAITLTQEYWPDPREPQEF